MCHKTKLSIYSVWGWLLCAALWMGNNKDKGKKERFFIDALKCLMNHFILLSCHCRPLRIRNALFYETHAEAVTFLCTLDGSGALKISLHCSV